MGASLRFGTSSSRTRFARAIRTRSRAALVTAALLAVGCGKSTPTYKVGVNSLSVRDNGYYYTDGHFEFCQGGGAGQMMLDFVDFNFICDPLHPSERDAQLPHIEMRIILTIGVAPDFNANMAYPTMKPYETGGLTGSDSDKENVPSAPVVKTVTGDGPEAHCGSV